MTVPPSKDLPLAPLTNVIVGSFYDCVHELGCGFNEHVCRNALQIVLRDKGLLVEAGLSLDVHFRGHEIGRFVTDLVVERLVIVEVKAMARLEPFATAQTLNYLRCAGGGVGLLVNFGRPPEIKRYVVGDGTNSLPRLSKVPGADIHRWIGGPARGEASG